MIGERVNNYQIVSVLGEGGMGAVYLAEHPFMGRKAAIKVLRKELAEDRSLVERFMNEARAANAIRHPNIIDIMDVGLLPSGIPYLMMEFLEGESLAKWIERQHPTPVADAVDVAAQTASALAAAHQKGIVHRDLKPDNLFLIPERGQAVGRVKVLDFGIAKLRGELSGSGAKTQTGSIMGTPPYMSPEQCRGVDELDHRTDIYALGIILYEMLTGTPPFVSPGWGEVVHMHISKPPPSPRASNPAVSPELEAVILKALAKQPDDRWGSMAEIETALRKAARTGATRDQRGAPAAMGAVGGTAILSSTTFRSATGQISDPSEGLTADKAALAGRSGGRRAALMVGGLALAGIVVAAVAFGGVGGFGGSGGRQASQSAATSAAPPPMAQPAATAPAQETAAPEPAAIAVPTKVPAAASKSLPAEAPLPLVEPAKPEPVAETPRKRKPKAAKPSHAAIDPAETPSPAISPPAATAKPAAAAKPDCNPNYYFDAEARKHFKPECF